MPTATTAPPRSIAQRMEALDRANEIRTKRAQLKRDLKAGRASIVELLLDPPQYLKSAKVFDILMAVPKRGRVKNNEVLKVARISPSKTVVGLSDRQRLELAAALGATLQQFHLFTPAPTQSAPAPWSIPPRRPSQPDVTRFQLALLRYADELGDAGPAHVDVIAVRMGTTVSGIGIARAALQRLRLLDEFAAPTPAGLGRVRESNREPARPFASAA